jgi:GTPase SAR1 family protein
MSENAVKYKRVAVIGSKHVGKTALLSRAICATFPREYVPTLHSEVFFDSKRFVEWVDTSGLDDDELVNKFG